MAYKGRGIFYGFLVWLIPTAITWGLVWLNVGVWSLSSSWYEVLANAIAAFLLVKHFAAITRNYVKEGIFVGATWFVIKAALTLPLLEPYQASVFHRYGWPSSDMLPAKALYWRYWLSTVPRFLALPIMSIGFGFVLSKQQK